MQARASIAWLTCEPLRCAKPTREHTETRCQRALALLPDGNRNAGGCSPLEGDCWPCAGKNCNRIRKGPVFFFGDGRSELDHVAARERDPIDDDGRSAFVRIGRTSLHVGIPLHILSRRLLLIAAGDFGLPWRDPAFDRSDDEIQRNCHQHDDDDGYKGGRGIEVVG
jgi:hypothetical protein